MGISDRVLAVLAASPWLTPAEVSARAPELKPGSVRVLLSQWGKNGDVLRRRSGRGYRYAIREGQGASDVQD